MDIYAATEEAYKRGFNLGLEVGRSESVVHGRWIEGSGSRYVCSVCNANAGLYGGGIGQNLSNYCPNCGAKMDLED